MFGSNSRSLFYAFLCWISLLDGPVIVVSATDVKWTSATQHSNSNHKDAAAKTAPRSQKYWDEHNVERPDYAKTDAELALGRGGKEGGGKLFVVIAMAAILGYLFVWPRMNALDGGSGSGRALGGSTTATQWFEGAASSSRPSEDTARQARLSRFEEPKLD